MGTPNLLSASLLSVTGSDRGTGSIKLTFSEPLLAAPAFSTSNYNISPSLTITSASTINEPEVWFKLDEGSGTSITSSNGLYSGSFQAGSTALSWESGSYSTGSYSLYFNKGNTVVTPPNAIWPGTSEDMITVAFWARMQGGVADDLYQTNVFEAANSSNQRIFNCHFPWTDGVVYWDAGNDLGASYDRVTYDWGASHKDNSQWHHWVFTKKISTGIMRIYLDGVDVANSSGNTRSFDNTNATRIGAAYNDAYMWGGNLSDFAIWNTELSASDVVTLYNDGSGSNPGSLSSSNLTVLYPFQEGDGSTCYDKSGNSRDGTIGGDADWALADPTPQPRTFVKFPGDISSYIMCDHNVNFGTGSTAGPMSVSAWVRIANEVSSYNTIVGALADSGWNDGWALYHYNGTDFRFMVNNYTSNVAYYSCASSCATQQWNHVVGTWDNSTIKIYVNGVKGTDDSYSGDMEFNNNPLRIGGAPASYNTDAQINDVRIYPGKALTQEDVTALYNERELHMNPSVVQVDATGMSTSQGYIIDVSSSVVSYYGGNPCTVNSGSFLGAAGRSTGNATNFSIMQDAGDGVNRNRDMTRSPGSFPNFSAQGNRVTAITNFETLTTTYFQRVYDSGTGGWCYYTKTTIDPTPESSETTPNYTGDISLHTVIQIVEVY